MYSSNLILLEIRKYGGVVGEAGVRTRDVDNCSVILDLVTSLLRVSTIKQSLQ